MRVVNDSKAADAPRSVVYRSATPLLDIAPNNERKLGLGGLAEAAARLRPGTKVGQHKMVVTCVECTSNRLCQREILWSWLVSATVAAPHVSQHYEALGLPDDREKRVKIRFENKHASTKNYQVRSHIYSCKHDSPCGDTRTFWDSCTRISFPFSICRRTGSRCRPAAPPLSSWSFNRSRRAR